MLFIKYYNDSNNMESSNHLELQKILNNKTIIQIIELLKNKILTVNRLIKYYENNYLKLKENNILITPNYEDKDAINLSQKNYDNNCPRALEGIPIILKDNFLTKDLLTTCGSKFLKDFIPGKDSNLCKILKNLGAIIVGKANMEEFAMGSLGVYAYNGPVINPHCDINNNKLLVGGSSSGSAASVLGDLCVVSFGSETGGSVRMPASWTGIIGYKPTYGSISREGLVPLANTLDTVGIFTKNMEDLEYIFNLVQVGHGDEDLSSVVPISIDKPFRKKIGIIKEFNPQKNIYNYEKVLSLLEKEGFELEEISVPIVEYGLSIYYNIVSLESMSNMARFDGIRYGNKGEGNTLIERYIDSRKVLGDEVKRRIVTGAYFGSSHMDKNYLDKILKIKYDMNQEFKKIFKSFDFILSPISNQAPSLESYKTNKIPLKEIYDNDFFTVISCLIGAPAISLPIGQDDQKKYRAIGLTATPQYDSWLFQISKQLSNQLNTLNN